jgi:hypothetical protein
VRPLLTSIALIAVATSACEDRDPPPAPRPASSATQVLEQAETVREAATTGLEKARREASANAPELDEKE